MKKEYITPELTEQLLNILDTITASSEEPAEAGPQENGYEDIATIFNWGFNS